MQVVLTSPYLTVEEAAAALGVSVWTVHRRVRQETLPALVLGPRLVRIEAQAVRPGSPPPVPASDMTASELEEWLRVSPDTVRRLMVSGRLPHARRGRHQVILRRSVLRLLAESTTGDGSHS